MTISIKNILFFFIAISLIFSLTKNIFDYQNKKLFYNQFVTEQKKAESENAKLKHNLSESKNPYEVEKILRNKLNLGKSNEYVVLLPSPELSPTPTPEPIKLPYIQWMEVFGVKIDQ
ncbi:MAG: FtsB family cell division protein [Candidatus Roizmanbacteria bacterium]